MNVISLTVLSSPVLESEAGSETGASVFSEVSYSLEDYNGLFITERMDALNFRHRISEAGYFSSWHVAGDPTLIIIRSGTLRITLRSGEYRDFSAGGMFIAQDRLLPNEEFNDEVHGHTAELVGEQTLAAVHIKLSNQETS
ncbi:hypothetical protein OFY17_05080 [Marinomonas sp. C2222]|uniref:Uncharacterized protein n=1 Tax=Marinomonas sargassi TaxID=2984494 RepID=A0ABT2YQU5_9GAMM|nr:hypothetical protein [Marinomonas sargassi]MCV2402258.1 hypothetical protein [Marinomonas sargassi]